MDPFMNFPPEKIEEICKKLDDVSLSKMMKSSSRVYQVCQKVFAKRKEDYLWSEGSGPVTWMMDRFGDRFYENDKGERIYLQQTYYPQKIKPRRQYIVKMDENGEFVRYYIDPNGEEIYVGFDA